MESIILLETDRLIIRGFEDKDFESLVSLMTDADTMKYTGFKVPQSKERIKELLSKWQQEGQQPLGVWAVESKYTKVFIGWVMLKPTTTEVPELGYMIIKNQWGNGFATEVGAAILKYAAHERHLSKIVAVSSSENIASMRILEKIGMKRRNEKPREDKGILYELEFKP